MAIRFLAGLAIEEVGSARQTAVDVKAEIRFRPMWPDSSRGKRGGALIACLAFLLASTLVAQDWPQWGGGPAHDGSTAAVAQPLQTILADIVYDPFVEAEKAEWFGGLVVHYAVPLVEGNDVYMTFKTGSYVPCNPPGSGEPAPCGRAAWNSQIWNVKKLSWRSGVLTEIWTFQSDWKPEPADLVIWEPVFLPVLAGGFLYVPGLGGTVFRVSKSTGSQLERINPFSGIDPSRFVAGGLAADTDGSIVYNAIGLAGDAVGQDVTGAWLVRIAPDQVPSRVPFSALVPGAPAPTDMCRGQFSRDERPWPPTPTSVPPSSPCGSQRPGVNVVPAIGADGSIYTVSRAHFNERYAYLVAAHPDLTPAWSVSLRGILNDGCGVLVPINDANGGCRTGAPIGVDPATNERPAGSVNDLGTSSPVVLPDGAVLFGASTGYNFGRGHLFKFSSQGQALATYDFGWDITPAVRSHGETYSVLIKDNHYFDPEGSFFDITSLDADLVREWSFRATNTESCVRLPGGNIECVDDHPDGFEWCVNQPAIDGAGVTYVNSEDGYLYAIRSDGTLADQLFLDTALGAAYTPLSIGRNGIVYTQNNGHLFAVGGASGSRVKPEPPAADTRDTRILERP